MTIMKENLALRPSAAVVLAAGMGTRLRSETPKALHAVAGAALVDHVLAAADSLQPERLAVVVGHEAERVTAHVHATRPDATAPMQQPQLGTAHAVAQARAALAGFTGDVFILYADTPFIRPETLAAMSAARAGGASVVVLGFEAAEPGGYGRLVTAGGALEAIVEAKEATPEQLAITLCNSGVMCVDGAILFDLIDRVDDDNAKKEFYLTDIVGLARADGLTCGVVTCDEAETLGVNSRADLAAAETAFQTRARAAAMTAGVTLAAPETVYFSYDTQLGRDVTVGPNVVFGPGVEIADKVEIRAFSHLENCGVATGAVIGPFARLRPGAKIGPDAHVGNFVEIKNAVLGPGAKANHLSYIGDASVGAKANIGAGTITCNYDGFGKHKTEIGEKAFIGSNSSLVAPVTIGDGAYVGSGSVVTDDVPADALAIGRGRQVTKPGFGARLKAKLAEFAAARKGAAE